MLGREPGIWERERERGREGGERKRERERELLLRAYAFYVPGNLPCTLSAYFYVMLTKH